MSNPHLPEELLDKVVDLLHDARGALKNCCLVSKSWIPRTRKHLFARLGFHTGANLQSWKNTFPDPSTSPARYTQTLFIDCLQLVTTADAEGGGWIPTFSRVMHFEADVGKTTTGDPAISLVPFHGFSPVVKSLRVTFTYFPLSCISDLINSFPLLEDLSVKTYDRSDGYGRSNDRLAQPLSPPVFTGCLELHLGMGLNLIASRLLSLSGGLHFRKLSLVWDHQSDVLLTTALVESCSCTLESLHIDCRIDESMEGLINLSKATKLKDVTFVWDLDPQWIISTLKTITSDHRNLQQISINTAYLLYCLALNQVDLVNFRNAIGEAAYKGWLDLDCLLVKLRESHLVRTKVLYSVPSSVSTEGARECIEFLFPEAVRSGMTELTGRGHG